MNNKIEDEIKELQYEIEYLEAQIAKKEDYIIYVKNDIWYKQEEIEELEAQIAKNEKYIKYTKNDIISKKDEIKELKNKKEMRLSSSLIIKKERKTNG
jgi:peptidoglycan hydrolase CwlO-like protein